MNTAGSDVSSSQEASLIGSMIVIINSLTLIWPLARKVLIGAHIEYYTILVWFWSLPHGCYMKYCGGEKRATAARERETQARAGGRRVAAGVSRQGPADVLLGFSEDRSLQLHQPNQPSCFTPNAAGKFSLFSQWQNAASATSILS